MQITQQLQKRLDQAVRVSMRIEGLRPSASLQVQARAKALMEQQRVQVVVTNAHRTRTSTAPVATGNAGKRRTGNERQTA